jgi:hypothetical protein
MTKLCRGNFAYLHSFKSLTFEPGSTLHTIEEDVFSGCDNLESIYIPASVKVIPSNCFADLHSLTSLIFEPGSKLTEIQDLAFSRCRSLKSISLPATLSVIDSMAFVGSCIEAVHVDEANPHYFVSGDFLVAFNGMTLIRYFGVNGNAVVVAEVESIADYCFGTCQSVTSVVFEKGSRLTHIGAFAFSCCGKLKSICIPAGVETLGDSCLANCWEMSELTFESGSVLSQIGARAFESCVSLPSICIPTGVEVLDNACLRECKSLRVLSFEPGSKLTRIDIWALSECASLNQITIPVRVEILGCWLFRDCKSLTELIFDPDTQVRELDLPPSEFGSLSIPDSVEVVTGRIGGFKKQNRILRFGPESRVNDIRFNIRPLVGYPGMKIKHEDTVFVCLSEQSLRRFRDKFESQFDGGTTESKQLVKPSRGVTFLSDLKGRLVLDPERFRLKIPMALKH